VQNIAEAMQQARACFARRQKAYADQKRFFLELEVGDEVLFHVNLLKRFKRDDTYCPPQAALLVDGEEEVEVDEILTHKPRGMKKTDAKVKFLVRWAGYKDEHNTCEPHKNLKSAPDALNEYWDTVAVRAAVKGRKRGPHGYVAPLSKKLKGK